jgi:probable phosphoglycerate mutase
MTVTLLLIRHAMHSDYGERFSGRADGIGLSDAGKAQAKSLGERLAAEPLAAISASPRERTRATAAAIAEHQKLPVITEAAIDEIDMGEWTRARIDLLRGDPAFAFWNDQRGSASPPGGEPFAAVAERVIAFAARTATAHDGRTIAVVSHADVIKALVASALRLHLDHVLRFEVGPASVTRLVWGDWGARLIALNEGAAD